MFPKPRREMMKTNQHHKVMRCSLLVFCLALLALCSSAQTIVTEPLWRLSYEQPRWAAVSPDGRYFATTSSMGVRLWNLDTGVLDWTFSDERWSYGEVAFSAEGNTLAVGVNDGVVLVLNPATGGLVNILHPPPGPGDPSGWIGPSVSPDGSRVFFCIRYWGDSISFGSTVRDISTGDTVHDFGGWSGMLEGFWSPDGRFLLSADGYHVRLWDAETGQQLHHFSSNEKTSAFIPDSSAFLVWKGKTARLFDTETGDLLHTFNDHTGNILDVAFSPNGQQLLVGCEDKLAWLWNVTTGTFIAGYAPPPFSTNAPIVKAVDFLADGTPLAIVQYPDETKTVEFFNVVSGDAVCALHEPRESLSSFVLRADDTQVVTYEDTESYPRVWDLQSGEVLHDLVVRVPEIAQAAFAVDSRHILTTHAAGDITELPDDRVATLWSIDTREPTQTFFHQNTNAQIIAPAYNGATVPVSPDGLRFATLYCADAWAYSTENDRPPGMMCLWDIPAGEVIKDYEIPNYQLDGWWYPNVPQRVTFSADGQRIAAAAEGGVLIWDAESQELLHNFGHWDGEPSEDNPMICPSYDDLALTPDHLYLLAHAEVGERMPDGGLFQPTVILDAETRRVLRRFGDNRCGTGFQTPLALSPDGTRVVVAEKQYAADWSSSKRRIRMYDVATGEPLLTFWENPSPADYVRHLAFSAEGRRVLISWGVDVEIYDAETGELVRVLKKAGHGGATFSPDGQYVVTCSASSGVQLWEAVDNPHLAVRPSATGMEVSWDLGMLQTAPSPTGPWTDRPDLSSPYQLDGSQASEFFRVKMEP